MQVTIAHCLATAVFLLMAATMPCAQAADTGVVYLSFAPADMELINRLPSGDGIPVLSNQVIAVCQFNDAAFSASGVEDIGIIAPDGRSVPLFINAANIGMEFGRIVSVRLAFPLPGDTPASPYPPYRLVWGPSSGGSVTVAITNWSVSPASAERYRIIRWSTDTAASGAGAQLASIEVIADSRAGYYSLWYLVPMAMIFLLLTIRKLYS